MRLSTALVAVTLLAAGCGGSSSPSAGLAGTSAAASPSSDVLTSVELEGEPYGVEAAGGGLWVEAGSEEAGPVLRRVDPGTHAVTVSLPGASNPLSVGPDLWYLSGKQLVRADPVTGAPRQRLTPPAVGRFAVGPADLWILTGDESHSTLLRVDRRSLAVRTRVPMPAGEGKDVLLHAGSVWVPVDGENVLVRVDVASGKLLGSVPAGGRPHSLAAGFGSVWVTDHGESALQRVDARTGKVVATVPDVGLNVAVAATDDALWVATSTGMARVDPATNAVTRRVPLPPPNELYDAAVLEGALWVTSVSDHRLYELPLT